MGITKNTALDYEKTLASVSLDDVYKKRQERVYALLRELHVACCVIEDSEDLRDPCVRYLTGHPSDAAVVLTAAGECVLIPWDEIMAEKMAHVTKKIPSVKYNRDNALAVKEIVQSLSLDSSYLRDGKLSVSVQTEISHQKFLRYSSTLEGCSLICSDGRDGDRSVYEEIIKMRSRKDEYEIACTRKACAITSDMTLQIIAMLEKGLVKNEMDVALFAERALRERGCERTSFDTLAAGPERSFAIHAFPGYTSGTWGSTGLSILDYGVCYDGYASDCTITVAKGPLSAEKVKQLDLVQKAADECLPLYRAGGKIMDASAKAAEVFAEAGRMMPHGLGHGTGLEIHEAPFINTRATEDMMFEPGNIVTLEPGLYDEKLGGCRLENDVLITEEGPVLLTNSKIFRM